jgi:hypothetical protein
MRRRQQPIGNGKLPNYVKVPSISGPGTDKVGNLPVPDLYGYNVVKMRLNLYPEQHKILDVALGRVIV